MKCLAPLVLFAAAAALAQTNRADSGCKYLDEQTGIVIPVVCSSLSSGAPLAQVPLAGSGTVTVTLSMATPQNCQALFSKSLCKALSLWVGTIRNDGADTVAIGPAAVLSRIPQLGPLTFQAAQILASQDQSKTWQARLMSALAGGSTAATAVSSGSLKGATKIAKKLTTTQVAFWASEFLLVEPEIAKFIQGAQPAILANLTALLWNAPIQLAPSASATFHLFTSAWAQSQAPVVFTIDMSKASTVRYAQ